MSGALATLTTRNATQYPAWITIYDVGEMQHMDYGDVAAGGSRDWTGGTGWGGYLYGSYYHVRYELKGPDGKNKFDTIMEVNPDHMGKTAKNTIIEIVPNGPDRWFLRYVNGG